MRNGLYYIWIEPLSYFLYLFISQLAAIYSPDFYASIYEGLMSPRLFIIPLHLSPWNNSSTFIETYLCSDQFGFQWWYLIWYIRIWFMMEAISNTVDRSLKFSNERDNSKSVKSVNKYVYPNLSLLSSISLEWCHHPKFILTQREQNNNKKKKLRSIHIIFFHDWKLTFSESKAIAKLNANFSFRWISQRTLSPFTMSSMIGQYTNGT